jgi:uncharacterized protein
MSKSPIVSRTLTKYFAVALKQYPFVSITGPRQSGKTTICHLVAHDYVYINLEIDKYKLFATQDPEGFLAKYSYKIILDEVQKVPTLFPYLMAHSDTQNKNGAYILSGSQNFLLMEQITQSLAGRVAIFSLLPFGYQELAAYLPKTKNKWMSLCLRGFYPRLFVQKSMDASLFYRSYVRTFVKKDMSQLANIHNLKIFEKLIVLLANRVGSILNTTKLGNDLNVDHKTIQKWLSYLESSYIIYQLPSYHNNLDKRIIKASKIYFYDVGLLCHLLNIRTEANLEEHELLGSIFENFIINEKMKLAFHSGDEIAAYYWQDSNKKEVDLIIEQGQLLKIYEIKSSSTPKLEFAKNLNMFAKLAKERGIKTKQYLIYTGAENYKQNSLNITDWKTAITNI